MATSPLASHKSIGSMKIGYIRDRTAVYKEKWDAAHPWNTGESSHTFAERRGDVSRVGRGAQHVCRLASKDERRGFMDSDTVSLMESGHGQFGGIPAGEASPWVGLESEIQVNLGYLRTLLKEFALMQAKAREDLFAKKKKDEVANKRDEIKNTIKQTAAKIDMLDRLPGLGDDKAIVARIRRTLGAQLAELGREFQHDEVKEIRQRSSRAAGAGSNTNMEALLAQVAEPTPAFTEHQMQELESTAQEYEKRDQEISAMLSTIHEIAEVMKDMNTLIIEQGTMIDRIDQNIEQAALSIEQGNDQIERANEASKKGSLINVIFCLAISVILAVCVAYGKEVLNGM